VVEEHSQARTADLGTYALQLYARMLTAMQITVTGLHAHIQPPYVGRCLLVSFSRLLHPVLLAQNAVTRLSCVSPSAPDAEDYLRPPRASPRAKFTN
jgi:hypothetical protein